MELLIHRGAREIGGTCIQIRSGANSILLDLGLPLALGGVHLDDGRTWQDLVQSRILPDVAGIYQGDDRQPEVEAVLVSHAHLDHYGLCSFLKETIPIFAGDPTGRLMGLTSLFRGKTDFQPGRFQLFKAGHPFQIGNFRITPFLVDHSAFDAHAFLIEADGKRVFYSGDLRAHGRKRKTWEYLLANGPKEVDAFLMEGTMLGRSTETVPSEVDVEHQITDMLNKTSGIALAWASSQNIDRLVSFYRAARKAGRIMAVDFYTAHVLESAHRQAKVCYPSKNFPGLGVYYPRSLSWKVGTQMDRKDLLYRFARFKIDQDDFQNNPGKYLVLIRPSMTRDVEKMAMKNGTFIYSLWSGYRKEPKTAEFLADMQARGLHMEYAHTSGHATKADLTDLVAQLAPKAVIPIHTEMPEAYAGIFPHVRQVADRVPMYI